MLKSQLIGFLGKDAVVNNTNGKSVINFNVAHTEKFKDAQGTQQSKTVWVQCSFWTDKTAVAPYLKKGTQVYVEGTPDVRSYTDQSGHQQVIMTLRVMQVQLLGSNQHSEQPAQAPAQQTAAPATQQAAAPAPADADDLPF